MGRPRPLFVYFRLFKQPLQVLQQINVKKCPSSMWCQDSNPLPSEYKSPPITTSPGLPRHLREGISEGLVVSSFDYFLKIWSRRNVEAGVTTTSSFFWRFWASAIDVPRRTGWGWGPKRGVPNAPYQLSWRSLSARHPVAPGSDPKHLTSALFKDKM